MPASKLDTYPFSSVIVVFEIICRRYFGVICRKQLRLLALTLSIKARPGSDGEDVQAMKGK
jgi:hypothetical protein